MKHYEKTRKQGNVRLGSLIGYFFECLFAKNKDSCPFISFVQVF